jgi:hypothetical protein
MSLSGGSEDVHVSKPAPGVIADLVPELPVEELLPVIPGNLAADQNSLPVAGRCVRQAASPAEIPADLRTAGWMLNMFSMIGHGLRAVNGLSNRCAISTGV